MPEQPNSLKPRLRNIGSNLMVVAMAAIAILLFMGITASAVWRAFSADSFPPTPTIPANLESNFVFVSGQQGEVFSQPPGAAEGAALRVGDTIGAGSGALVRTGEDGWLRLGSQAGTFFMGEETEIELRQLGDARENRPETILQLNRGIMLLVADPNADVRYVVFAETGARAETEAGMMGLTYDRTTQRLDLYCLRGPCWLIGVEGETLALATGEHGWVQGFGEPVPGDAFLYELFFELADPGLVPTATPLSGGVTPIIVSTPNQPTPTPVQLPPTKPPATFTPKPTLVATETEAAPAATTTAATATATTTPVATATAEATAVATEEATVTPPASATPLPTEAASVTPPPTLPPASSTPLPTSTPEPTATSLPTSTAQPTATPVPATATSMPAATVSPTPAETVQPTVTVTTPADTATPTPTPVSPG